ncbi:MAG: hypothetical protein E6K01_02410 [Methanobacteriota archaeon]|nr:MAG: hypothetical protein E6K01_02410 [Euryarchaeota archaeon]
MRILIRDIRRDEEGVASTVGTIMALLVFLTFLSLIVNQYVPVWMKDSEASHMNGALGQFGGIKGAIDLQILAAQAAQISGTHYIPVTASSAVSLGVDGVPIFAASTLGTLQSFPDGGPFTVSFDYLIRGVSTHVQEQSNGSIELDVGNRYYVPQKIAYENGAVIRYQSDGQVIRAQPTFSVVKTNNTLDISFGLVSLYGAGSVSGTSTEVVNTQVFAFDRQDYQGFPANAVIWVNHTSRYGLSWYRFLNQTLAGALNLGGSFCPSPLCPSPLDISYTGKIGVVVIYKVSASYNPAARTYTMRLEIHNSALLALSFFRLQHAQVQVGVGDTSSNVQF